MSGNVGDAYFLKTRKRALLPLCVPPISVRKRPFGGDLSLSTPQFSPAAPLRNWEGGQERERTKPRPLFARRVGGGRNGGLCVIRPLFARCGA